QVIHGVNAQRLAGIELVLLKNNQPIGLRVGKGPEQDRVHEGENGGVCSNAYGQRENRDGTEPRALTNRAERVLHILANAVEKLKPPGLSALLFTLIDAAHFAKRSVASFLRRQTRCGVLLRQPLQMIKELFVQLAIQLAALEQRAEPQAKLARPAH